MNEATLRKQFSHNSSHKVILLGDYGVGKTSLFHRIKTDGSSKQLLRQNSTTTTDPLEDTIDYCSRIFTLQNGKQVQVDFWDTGSAERFRGSLTGNYYRGATGVILMYDAMNPGSLISLHTWMEDAESCTNNATFLLLGNKYDSASGSYQVDNSLSNSFASHKEISLHFKISAEHSDEATLTHVFQTLAEHMHRKIEENALSATTDTSTVVLLKPNHAQPSCKPWSCSKR